MVSIACRDDAEIRLLIDEHEGAEPPECDTLLRELADCGAAARRDRHGGLLVQLRHVKLDQERPFAAASHTATVLSGPRPRVSGNPTTCYPSEVIAVAVTGFAVAAGGGDEQPLTGTRLERARDAALEHTGGGTVIETETGDDGAAYGVEVRLASGRVVEVSLDGRYAVIGSAVDDDGPNDTDDDGESD